MSTNPHYQTHITKHTQKMIQISCAHPRIRFKRHYRQLSRKSWRKQYTPQRTLRETVPPPSGFGVWSCVKIATTKQRQMRSLKDIYDDPLSAVRINESESAPCNIELEAGEDEKTEDLAGNRSTIWRPDLDRLRASVAEMEGFESEKEEMDTTKKGVKRKRAPRTKGPCEHGVKPRSKCKVCSACPHGKRRNLCKECDGSAICLHGRQRFRCRECGGGAICEHGRQRYTCKECGGKGICEHNRHRSACKQCKLKKVANRTSGVVCVLIEETPALELLKMYNDE